MTQLTHEPMLDQLQRAAFAYFLDESNPANGLVKDCTRPGSPVSIAAVGFALAAYPIGVERGFLSRTQAVERTLPTLRFFWIQARLARLALPLTIILNHAWRSTHPRISLESAIAKLEDTKSVKYGSAGRLREFMALQMSSGVTRNSE